MPYLTLPPSTRRRDRWFAHPELALGPAWVILGLIGVRDAIERTPPWHSAVLSLAVVTALAVSVAGVLLVASVCKQDPLSTVWALERAGWITGATGWSVYFLGVGWRSDIVIVLAPAMVAIAGLRLVALARTEAHVRAVKVEQEEA
ncbi:hypothetical protein [Ornithinimicrobium sufpigmenti]|uniref:hypothetical protein n=1 Tax=Ornithinimicrobium sufpigmenti TaxID=2508882 RepID=UPI0010362B5D|nr:MULTISPECIES: hypothetical protein [unclassified Ornithinimicrobium]